MYFLQPGQKRLLTSLNPLFMGVFIYLLILFRTTSDSLMPSVIRHWDFLLPFIFYVGQRRSMAEGLLLVLFTSHLYSLCSAAPIGVFASFYLFVFFTARLLSYVIYAETWFSILWLIFCAAAFSRILLPLIADFFGHGWGIFTWANLMPASWGVNAIGGVFVYWCLMTLDQMTYKVPVLNIELGEKTL